MIICVQCDHLLPMLREMCAHKNLATYTPAKRDVSRVQSFIFEIGIQKQWAASGIQTINENACIDTRPDPVPDEMTRPHSLVID